LVAEGYDPDKIVSRVCDLMQVEPSELWAAGKKPKWVEARSLSVVLLGGKRAWYWYGSNSKPIESLIGRGESVGKAKRDNSTTKGL
jgi:hypothetical protein